MSEWLIRGKTVIDPLSAALALCSVILCSQTAQQSITETFERRERGKRILIQVSYFYGDALGFCPIYMRIMCEWPPIKPGSFRFESNLLFFFLHTVSMNYLWAFSMLKGTDHAEITIFSSFTYPQTCFTFFLP